MSNALSRTSVVWTILVGSLLLIASLVLYAMHGVILMGYEDHGYGAWNWAQAKVWLASLSPNWRIAFWVTAIGAPASLLAGATVIVIGVRRVFSMRGV
jgi:hypothetical protein